MLLAASMDARFHIRKYERMRGEKYRENRKRKKKCGWRGLSDSGVASIERGSVMGMKIGRKRKENVKKERK